MEYTRESIEELKRCFGSPLYVFDEAGFIDNYRKLEYAMRSQYSEYRIAYSFKTNYTPYICALVKKLGGWAEVVSGMEYAIAKRVGFDDSRILFNGPDKGDAGEAAFLNGCMIHADGLDEFRRYCRIAAAHPERAFKIGLRIHLDIAKDFISRFGMDTADAEQAVSMAAKVENLKIAGLHCHISRCRGKEAWRMRTEKMLALADRLFESAPEYLDLGSGMFGSMAPEFAAQFGEIPSYEDYAQVTASLVAEHYRGSRGPVLFTEPGTTLINRFVDCIAEVRSIKTIDGHSFAVLNASEHNLGETCLLKKLPIRVIPGGQEQREYAALPLTGYTCLEQDVLYPDYTGKLAAGDFVVFGNTGGYSNVLKPPFIRPNCAMVARREAGGYALMKAAESYDDLLRTYVFEGL